MTDTRDLLSAATERSGPLACREAIFLDFQATTPLDPLVFEAMLPWMSGAWNAHAIEHGIGRTACAAVERAREQVAELLGCKSAEITFTSGATEASNIVLRGVTGPGDGIAISALEHASVMETAYSLETDGRVVRRLGVSEDGVLDLEALEACAGFRAGARVDYCSQQRDRNDTADWGSGRDLQGVRCSPA